MSKRPVRSETKTLSSFCDFLKNFPSIEEEQASRIRRVPTDREVEITLHDCPTDAFAKDFARLFPDNSAFTPAALSFRLAVFSFRTDHDMSGWSGAVETERAALADDFLGAGFAVCGALRRRGFWADVVDAATGKPQRGGGANDALFEIDDRLRPFGVGVEDLGCCKCVRHREFGTRAFLGFLFSDASFEEMERLLL